MRSLAETNTDGSYGEPDEWEFTYEWSFIQTAFWMWAMSDFQRLPTQDEVKAYDPDYIGDMKLAYSIYSHQKNTNAVMYLLEQWESYQDNPEAMKQHISILKAQYEREKESEKMGIAGDKSPYPENFGE